MGRGGELRAAVMPLVAAVRQVGMIGDDAQRQSARVVLDGAARAIYAILANGPSAPGPQPAASDPAQPAEAGVVSDAGTTA